MEYFKKKLQEAIASLNEAQKDYEQKHGHIDVATERCIANLETRIECIL